MLLLWLLLRIVIFIDFNFKNYLWKNWKIKMVLIDIEYLLSYLEVYYVLIIKKKWYIYLIYYGLVEYYMYVLKDGIIKNSIIL